MLAKDMFKRLALFAIFSLGQANAAPVKGDFIIHECTVKNHPPYTVKTELSEVDTKAGTAEMRITYSMPAAIPQVEAVALDELTAGEALMKNLLGACGGEMLPGGKLFTLETPMGTLQTCRLSGKEGESVKTTYLAQVPFQMLVLDSENFHCSTLSFKKF
ncbi:MAG: hypothetical protein H7333_05285 [Bdellovibrionales bacterium]|nr:hypothetical protein [Oligoflexia bacterium]